MELRFVEKGSDLEKRVIPYAKACSWDGGPGYAEYLEMDLFTDFERAAVALEGDEIAGFCNVLKEDCLPNLPYTPYIGFLFVDEKYRGQRLSQRLLTFCEDYLRDCGFQEAYLTTDHDDLYEKYGYVYLESHKAFWGEVEKLYRKDLTK